MAKMLPAAVVEHGGIDRRIVRYMTSRPTRELHPQEQRNPRHPRHSPPPMSPQNVWQQPLLRLVDTVVDIALGGICKWIGSYLFYLGERRYVRSS